MATKPLQNAYTEITVGSEKKSAYTDATGKASAIFSLSKRQYDALARIGVTSQKSGYKDGQGNITALPPFIEAVNSKIQMEITMQKNAVSVFEISPISMQFPADGGVQSLTVTCPDDTWEIYSSDSRLLVSKQSSTTINVTCPSGTTAMNASLQIRWYSPDSGWQYRTCSVYRSAPDTVIQTITFTGTLIDNTTGLPIANRPRGVVIIGAYTEHGEDSSAIAIGETDGDGNFSIPLSTTKSEYDGWVGLTAFAWPTDYDFNASDKYKLSKPPWDDAVSNGISFDTIYLTKTSGDTKDVYVTGIAKDSITNEPIKGLIVFAQSVDTTITTGFGTVSTDSSGKYVFGRAMGKSEYDALASSDLIISAINVSLGYGYKGVRFTLPTYESISGNIQVPDLIMVKS